MSLVNVYINVGRHELHVTGTYCPAERGSWSEYSGGTPPTPEAIEGMVVHVVRGKKERRLPESWDTSEYETKALKQLEAANVR